MNILLGDIFVSDVLVFIYKEIGDRRKVSSVFH